MTGEKTYRLASFLSLFLKPEDVDEVVEKVCSQDNTQALNAPWEYCKSLVGKDKIRIPRARFIVFLLLSVVVIIAMHIHISDTEQIMQMVRLSVLAIAVPTAVYLAIGTKSAMTYDRVPKNAMKYALLPFASISGVMVIFTGISKVIVTFFQFNPSELIQGIRFMTILSEITLIALAVLALVNAVRKTLWHICVASQLFGALLTLEAFYLFAGGMRSTMITSLTVGYLLCSVPFIVGVVVSYFIALRLYFKIDDDFRN